MNIILKNCLGAAQGCLRGFFMGNMRRYKKKDDQYILAVQLNLDTPGFTYRKWGAEQRCKKGDWLVDNDGEGYTIDKAVFKKTYRMVTPGRYVKTTTIWAQAAAKSGSVETAEGVSHYEEGDYLVCNNEDGTDAYCIGKEKFEAMYAEKTEGHKKICNRAMD